MTTNTAAPEFDWSDWSDEELAAKVAQLQAKTRKGAYQRRALASAEATLAGRSA